MTKSERIQQLESRVAELQTELHTAEWELEKTRGSGPMIDKFFEQIEASGKSYNEVIEFLKGRE